MFWKKAKAQPLQHTDTSDLLRLAQRLGVERRKNVRIRYPSRVHLSFLPTLHAEGFPVQVQDLSIGGCCLLDPEERLGPQVGQDVTLYLHWPFGIVPIQCRIVARVDKRRHTQFLDLSARHQQTIKNLITPGVLGLSVRMHTPLDPNGPTLEAHEIWSSLHGHTVTIESDVHLQATVELRGDRFLFYREAWPIKSESKAATVREVEDLLLFLANIPSPSSAMSLLIERLQNLLSGRLE